MAVSSPIHESLSSISIVGEGTGLSSFSPDSLYKIRFDLRHGECSASQVLDPFPVVSPEIVVREARVEDWWEVAETRYTAPSSLDIRSRLILSSELIGRWQ
nr:PREDICTED: uncharacterized protein LOC108846771 isoform X2 [Raphanus sativus]XP_018475496.1 PREDICTED: uncharacterized protein LOC108846789 isoform X2 [Raphanus sativus]